MFSAGFCKFDALFVCHGGHRKGCALSEQRLSNWVFDIIMQAYRLRDPGPPVKCHSTKSGSTLWAALKGIPLNDICAAVSSCTFAHIYRVDVPPPSSCGNSSSVCSFGLQLRLEYGLLFSLLVWVIQVLHTFSGSQEEYNETNVTKVL